jgi:hypothetical protein
MQPIILIKKAAHKLTYKTASFYFKDKYCHFKMAPFWLITLQAEIRN